jgi:hypothetical protein
MVSVEPQIAHLADRMPLNNTAAPFSRPDKVLWNWR